MLDISNSSGFFCYVERSKQWVVKGGEIEDFILLLTLQRLRVKDHIKRLSDKSLPINIGP